jgi:hypothetical protein
MKNGRIFVDYSVYIHNKKTVLNNITNRSMILLSYLFFSYSHELKFKAHKTYFALDDVREHMDNFEFCNYSSINLQEDLKIIEFTTLGENGLIIINSIKEINLYDEADKKNAVVRAMNNDKTEWVIEFSRPTMEIVSIIIEKFLMDY